jgi:hypothetical protein
MQKSYRIVLLALSVAGLAAGCSTLVGGVEGDGSPTPSDVAHPAETDRMPSGSPERTRSGSPECYVINESVDTLPRTVVSLTGLSTSVVVAEVATVGEGEWNTSDGSPPDAAAGPDFNPAVRTPIDLQVTEWISGERDDANIVAFNAGGVAGCVEHIVDNAPRLNRGDAYAFFLQPSDSADGSEDPSRPQILMAFPVSADGSVSTEEDGVLSHEEFVALVEHPVQPTVKPEATPDGTDDPG